MEDNFMDTEPEYYYVVVFSDYGDPESEDWTFRSKEDAKELYEAIVEHASVAKELRDDAWYDTEVKGISLFLRDGVAWGWRDHNTIRRDTGVVENNSGLFDQCII
jgi:hypothetical protein